MVMLGDGPFEGWASGYDNDVYIEPEKQECVFGPGWVEHESRVVNLSNEVEFLEAIWWLIAEVVGRVKYHEYEFSDIRIIKVKHNSRSDAPDEIRFLNKNTNRMSVLTRLEVFHWGCIKALCEGEDGKIPKLRTFINKESALELIALKYYETL